jgi:hypothetical protein
VSDLCWLSEAQMRRTEPYAPDAISSAPKPWVMSHTFGAWQVTRQGLSSWGVALQCMLF